MAEAPNPDDIARSIAESSEIMEPFFEAAKGLRTKLESEGWTMKHAEEIATAWLVWNFRSAS